MMMMLRHSMMIFICDILANDVFVCSEVIFIYDAAKYQCVFFSKIPISAALIM